MSEKNTNILEKHESTPQDQEEQRERPVEQPGEQARLEANQSSELQAAREEVAKQASSMEKDKVAKKLETIESPSASEPSKMPASADLKKQTLNKEFKHIRRMLNKPDRIASKVIHQPVIRQISEVSSKTITRPSGLLGGGITAFLGTSIYLYFTKHIGLRYNYSMFLFLLLAGFILGLLLEALFRLVRGRKTT
ncbi:MAG: hypothetical protein ACYCPS_02415 [Candidatus Saccharimonadales bacterium]